MSEKAIVHRRFTDALAARVPVAMGTVVRGPKLGAKLLLLPSEEVGTLGDFALDAAVGVDARQLLAAEKSEMRTYALAGDEVDVFLETFPTPPTLLVIGAVHVAQALCSFGKALGFDVVVVDAREKLATPERFPDADRIVVAWPDEALAELDVQSNWCIAILTHDPKFDEPAILSALATPARYIGAIGSRKTNADRRRRLTEAGLSAQDLERVRGPIGLDIGAATPEEMAISILGEIIAARNGRAGGVLTAAFGHIRGDTEGSSAATVASEPSATVHAPAAAAAHA
jgi:xanthine dehydrogenase accessory factor